jgi:hypothetical protein
MKTDFNLLSFLQGDLTMVLNFIFCLLIALAPALSHAQVLFEGYSKIISGGVHVGYAIQKYEFNNKKKQFVATTFLKTNELAGNLTESLQAFAAEDMTPVSYKYTTLVGTEVKTIDASFKNGKILATINHGGKTEKVNREIPKGTFLSSFLAYMMLKSPSGIKMDTKFEYQAIAEEDASVEKGIAAVSATEEFKGLKAFKILNEFKKAKFISTVSEKGEVFATRSPAQSISTELVSNPSEATANFGMPSAVLKQLFGDVPTGQENQIAKLAKSGVAVPSEPTLTPGKQQGVPQGKGLQLKGGSGQ